MTKNSRPGSPGLLLEQTKVIGRPGHLRALAQKCNARDNLEELEWQNDETWTR